MPDSRKEPKAISALSDSTRSQTIPPVNNAIHPLVPVKYNYADSFLCTYFVSILAAINAELYTYPLDLTKTRLQIQGEAAATKLNNATTSNAKHRGMFATAAGIVKEEGFLKLWRGMLPAVYRHCVYSGVRISCYDYLRQTFPTTSADGKPVQAPLWKSAMFGVTAGCIAQFLASPADLIKVQLQMEGKRQLMGEKPRVLGTYHAFQEIVRRGGVRGLWKGSIPNVQRAAFVNLGDLTAYDVSKRFLMEKMSMPDCPTVHVLASLCAGVVGALLGTPADVIKTRVMNQPTDEKGRGLHYKGSLDCLRQTVAEEGLTSLYKGFTPCWMRLGPWALIFWVSFEQIKSLLGGAGY